MEEFQEIIKSALLEYLSVTERVLNIDTEKVFRLFDDDNVSPNTILTIISCSRRCDYRDVSITSEQPGGLARVLICFRAAVRNDA